MQQMNKQTKNLFVLAGIFGALAVAIGAFGAHALKPMLTEAGRLDTFETAVKYHFFHVLALLAIAILHLHLHYRQLLYAGYFFLLGTVLFSGSLYIISVWPGLSSLGIVTPFGGLCFIAGWLFLVVAVVRNPSV